MPKKYKVSVGIWGGTCKRVNNILHCDTGPAVERLHGDKVWYLNGKRHRKNGPAVEYDDGGKEWYFDGAPFLNEEEFREKVSGQG